MKIYVVRHYDCITYVGTVKKEAIAVARGGDTIQVWLRGKLDHHLKHSFKKKMWEKI